MSSYIVAGNQRAGQGWDLPGPPHPPPARRLRALTNEVKAKLGTTRDKKHRYNRCIRCWEERTPLHLDQWRQCPKFCPSCPDHKQHWGKACPNLLDDTNDEWWRAHAGPSTPKPEWRVDHLPNPPYRRTGSQLRSGWNHQTGLRGGRHARSPSPALLPGGRRSRSPSREREREYRDRDPNRGRAPGTGRPLLSLRVPDLPVLPDPDRDGITLPLRPLESGNGATTTFSRPDTERAASSSDAAQAPFPTGLLWSNGSVTSPTVRELLQQDPCISMIIHQTLVFTDFCQRHPEAFHGEQLITEDMRRYLDDVRASRPDYLSTTPTSTATPRSGTNGAVGNGNAGNK